MHKLESLSQPEFVEEDAHLLSPELHETFGNNKKLLPEFELAALTALSFYPELLDVRIEFVYSTSNIPVSAHPKYSSVFRKPRQRTYMICVSHNLKKERVEVQADHLSFNALVGLFAHELAHICDYLKKSSFETLAMALKYPFRRYKRNYERKIDLLAVAHGMGNQLKEFASLIQRMKEKAPKDSYFRHYFEYYLKPEEIDRILMIREKAKAQNPFDEQFTGRKKNRR